MSILITIILLPIISYIVLQLAKITKIPVMIAFIIIGLIFGVTGFVDIFGMPIVKEPLDWFTNTIALNILFFMAGFSITLKSINESRTAIIKQSIVPIYVSAIISGIVGFYIYKLLNLDFVVTLYSMILLTGSVAISTLALLIPTLSKAKVQSKNSITPIIMGGSAIESITFVPLMLILSAMALGSGSVGSTIVTIVIVLVIAIILLVIGYIIAVLFGKFAKPIESKSMLYTVLIILIISFLIQLMGQAKSMAIILPLVSGCILNSRVSKENYVKISKSVHTLFVFYVLPSLFIGVGASMDWRVFINFKVILFILIIFVLIAGIKGYITLKIHKNLTPGEKKFSFTSISLVGAGAINMSVILSGIFTAMGAPGTTQLMAYTGTVLYIIIILIDNYILDKNQDKWLSE